MIKLHTDTFEKRSPETTTANMLHRSIKLDYGYRLVFHFLTTNNNEKKVDYIIESKTSLIHIAIAHAPLYHKVYVATITFISIQ